MNTCTTILTLCIGLAAAIPVLGNPRMSPDQAALSPLINDKSLDDMTKIRRIGEFFKDDPNCHKALMWVARVDVTNAVRRLKREFKNPKRDQQEKLKIGRTLLTDERFKDDKQFIDDYAPWLIDQVIAQQATFKKELVDGQLTPVGEYANIANNSQGFRGQSFAKIEDNRLIPILISALDMPDNVFGEHQDSCVVRGIPGEPTGRNLDRQNVPVALAKLGAVEAVPALRRTLEIHHDWNFRDNAAFALGVLLKPTQREELVDWMKKHKNDDYKMDRFRHLFAFGKGLLKRGDDAGVHFMSFAYSTYYNELKLSEVTHMYDERLELLKNLRSEKLASFYKQAFEYEPLLVVFLFDEKRVLANDYGNTNYDLPKAESRIISMFEQTATSIEKNGLTQLKGYLQILSETSQNKSIRERAKKSLQKLD